MATAMLLVAASGALRMPVTRRTHIAAALPVCASVILPLPAAASKMPAHLAALDSAVSARDITATASALQTLGLLNEPTTLWEHDSSEAYAPTCRVASVGLSGVKVEILVAAPQTADDYLRYVWLSDASGKLIAARELKRGDEARTIISGVREGSTVVGGVFYSKSGIWKSAALLTR